MEKFNRAVRRHQTARLKKARKNYWGMGHPYTNPATPRQLGFLVNNPATCSKPWCCGNPRTWYGRAFDEIVQEIILKESIHELESCYNDSALDSLVDS